MEMLLDDLIADTIAACCEYNDAREKLADARICLETSIARQRFDAAVRSINIAEIRRNKAETALINYIREGTEN